MEQQSSDHWQQLQAYIAHNRAAGVHDDAIRQALVGSGWPADLVARGLAGGGSAPAPGAQPPAGYAAKEYKVFPAITDAVRAVRANLKGFILTMLVVGGGVMIATLLLVLAIAGVLGVLTARGPGVNGIEALFYLVIMAAVVILWYVFVVSFFIASIAIVLDDGAAGRRSTLGSVMRRVKGCFMRVAAANAYAGGVIFGPVAALFVLILLGAALGGEGFLATSFLAVFAMFGGVIWAIYWSLRLVLAPFVAVFEPEVSPRGALQRSRHLLQKGGNWFVAKLVFTYIGVELLLAAVTHTRVSDLEENPVAQPVLLVLALILAMALTMLYRNRRAVRG